MLTLSSVGFYLFDSKVFGDTEGANRDKSPHSFYALSKILELFGGQI